jgi:hypothetical protein
MIRPLAALTLAIAIAGHAAMLNTSKIEVINTVLGTHFLIIESAIDSFRVQNLNVQEYEIKVVRRANAVIVAFTRSSAAAADLRRAGFAAYEVQVDPDALRVIRANFTSSALPEDEMLDTIQGTSLIVIEIAARVFRDNKLDLRDYRVTVMRDGDSRVVIFTDKNAKPGGRGNAGVRPGLEVEIDRSLHVVRSNFIR